MSENFKRNKMKIIQKTSKYWKKISKLLNFSWNLKKFSEFSENNEFFCFENVF